MSSLLLSGLVGSKPLAFLAAVGTLRLCDLLWPGGKIRLHWVDDAGWRPVLSGLLVSSPTDLCRTLAEHGPWAPLSDFERLGNNLTVSADTFRAVAGEIARDLHPSARRALDFITAFGNECFEDKDKGRIEYTDFSFITGSGHQHFLGTARNLQSCVGPDHLNEALFGPWRFADKGNSFRWDPEDAKEYALRWRDPSVGGASAVWGANLLAFEALPFFPTIPTAKGLRTTGFRTEQGGAHEFTWPIWTQPANAATVRSLLSLRELEAVTPPRDSLSAMGIREAFRAQRVRIGQGANFKVNFRPARSV